MGLRLQLVLAVGFWDADAMPSRHCHCLLLPQIDASLMPGIPEIYGEYWLCGQLLIQGKLSIFGFYLSSRSCCFRYSRPEFARIMACVYLSTSPKFRCPSRASYPLASVHQYTAHLKRYNCCSTHGVWLISPPAIHQCKSLGPYRASRGSLSITIWHFSHY